MPITPFFSLSGLSPFDYQVNPGSPGGPYARAWLFTGGGITSLATSFSLTEQHTNDEIIIGGANVPTSDVTITTPADWRQHSYIRVAWYGHNVSTENQYLLLYSLRRVNQTIDATAQFFVGNNLVDTQEIVGDEQVAILIDCPGDGALINLFVRLASDSSVGTMGFGGVDCFLL